VVWYLGRTSFYGPKSEASILFSNMVSGYSQPSIARFQVDGVLCVRIVSGLVEMFDSKIFGISD